MVSEAKDIESTGKALSPVEDPISDITIVVTCLLASRGEWVDDFGLPVIFDQGLKILSVCWSWIGDVMVGKPALKLCLMPFIVNWISD